VVVKTDSSNNCSSTDSLITAVASGGTLPYQYSWTWIGYPAGTTQTIKATSSEYTVNVTDSNGCTASIIASVFWPGIVIDRRQSNDTLFAIPSGGKPPYTYTWQDSSQVANQYPINRPIISTKPYCVMDSAAFYTVYVTDSVGCWTYYTFPASPDSIIKYNLTGNIPNYNTGQNAIVYLLIPAGDSSIIVLDSLFITSPTFQFSNLPDSVYVYYVPDTAANPFSLPTYYSGSTGTIFFNASSPVVFNSADTTITLASVTGADSGGVSSLAGTITSAINSHPVAYNFRTGPTGSVAGIKLVLVDSLGRPVQTAATNAAGNFYFHYLKNGTYTLWVDQPSFPNDNPPVVHVTSTNNMSGQYTLTATSLQRVGGITSITGSSASPAFSVYPNPTNSTVTINSPEAGQVSVYSMLGELITTQPVAAGNATINLGAVPTGIYTVILMGQSAAYTPVKVVKN